MEEEGHRGNDLDAVLEGAEFWEEDPRVDQVALEVYF